MSEEKNHLIFVYGTLKTNQPNHDMMEDSENGAAKLICPGKTSELYPLIIATRYNSPYMLKKAGVGHQINGEIYSIDEKMLQTLDKFENHPHLFERQEAKIIKADDGSETICWMYFLTKYPDDMIESNILLSNYECTPDHPYTKPRDRPKSPKPIDDLRYHYNTRC